MEYIMSIILNEVPKPHLHSIVDDIHLANE